MAGAGNVGQASVGRSVSGVSSLTVGTEKGRWKTKGLYTEPRVVHQYSSGSDEEVMNNKGGGDLKATRLSD